MDERPPDDDDLAALARAGPDLDARFGAVFERHRARLERAVGLRLDPALRARLGASDVLQDAWVEARERLPEYLGAPRVPVFVWLRFLALQRLAKAYRYHAGAQRRALGREARLDAAPAASSAALAEGLAASQASPSLAVAGQEARAHLTRALETLSPADREILALRQFEELSNAEAAQVLAIAPEAAAKRHTRALERLAKVLREQGADPRA